MIFYLTYIKVIKGIGRIFKDIMPIYDSMRTQLFEVEYILFI